VNFRHFEAMSRVVRGVRRTGSAALDLCYVAAGRSDGFWELSLSPWDTAAGQVIVEEAGGRVTDFSGRAFSPNVPEVLATNGKIHDAMIAVLNQSSPTRRD
jgi:myo-inositol-1(or 4)-monophosphatase